MYKSIKYTLSARPTWLGLAGILTTLGSQVPGKVATFSYIGAAGCAAVALLFHFNKVRNKKKCSPPLKQN